MTTPSVEHENNRKTRASDYVMESGEESLRLELKTDPEAVRKQALFCGVKPGLRILDAGCGPGKTSAILNEMIEPGGMLLGIDYSEARIQHAKACYGTESDIEFRVHDLRDPLNDTDPFDLIWVRFVLEYNRKERLEIIRNLTTVLKPGGQLCLLDLDHNALNHYGLPENLEKTILEIMRLVETEYNFDPYAGRKLYAALYDMGYEEIQVELMAHHLIYGETGKVDAFNWLKKAEMATKRAVSIVGDYPGGSEGFVRDFSRFFNDPRRFTYTPLIICKGKKTIRMDSIRRQRYSALSTTRITSSMWCKS